MSYGAFTDSAEACVLGEDPRGLRTLNDWFNDLFQNRSERFTREHLLRMEENWRVAAARRTRARLGVRRGLAISAEAVALEGEDFDTLEDIFATVQTPIGTLNIDYAGNNIRNLAHVREVLQSPEAGWTGKQSSELKLLGFAAEGHSTPLGQMAARAGSSGEVAQLWCRWIQQTDNTERERINSRLLTAKRVFPRFWLLQPDVRTYFLENAENPRDRETLKLIELLCNAGEVVQELSLEDIRPLTPLLQDPRRLPHFIQVAIADYNDNKGRRGWRFLDRRTLPLAWRAASERR